MKDFASYVHDLRSEHPGLTVSTLFGTDESTRILSLLHVYLGYCMQNPDASDARNKSQQIIIPLSTFLEQFAQIHAYYLQIHRLATNSPDFNNSAAPRFLPPQKITAPIKEGHINERYQEVQKIVATNVARVVGEYRFEHSTLGRITHPNTMFRYGAAVVTLLFLTLIIEVAHMDSFPSLISTTSLIMGSLMIAACCATIYLHIYKQAFRHTNQVADQFQTQRINPTENRDLSISHAYYSKKDQILFSEKKSTLGYTVNKLLESAEHIVENNKGEVDIIERMITTHTLCFHYSQIYSTFDEYKQGMGLLQVQPADLEPGCFNILDENEQPLRPGAFRNTPFEPMLNINEFNKSVEKMKHRVIEHKRTHLNA